MTKLKRLARTVTLIVFAIGISPAHAAVSEEEAKQLGGPVLNALGAERAGNKEGTIPEYNEKGVKPPPSAAFTICRNTLIV